MRWTGLATVIILAFALRANAESAKVIKVLPHFLDLKGRTALNPSLFDRDAYQNELRGSKTNRSALRFDVQWKAAWYAYEALKVRVEARGMNGRLQTTNTLEQAVQPPNAFSKWTALTLAGDEYKNFGELISWRVTLVNGTNVVAEQKSFLW